MFPLMEAERESPELLCIRDVKTFTSGGQLFTDPSHTKEKRSPFPWFPSLCSAEGPIINQTGMKCDWGLI